MKHFQDEDYDSMKDYEFSLMHHSDDMNNEDYGPIVKHFKDIEDTDDDDYGPIVKHFKE